MTAFDRLWVWDDPAFAKSLGWYLVVASNRKPAKVRGAGTVPVAVSLADAGEDGLWQELARLTPVFLARLGRIRDEGAALGAPAPGPGLLDLCREPGRRRLGHGNFCRWSWRGGRAAARCARPSARRRISGSTSNRSVSKRT